MSSEDPRNIDYEEKTSVVDVHASVQREKAEPRTGMEPVSQWVVFLGALILMVGAGYLGAYNGGFDMENIYAVPGYEQAPRPLGEGEARAEQQLSPELWLAKGKKVYNNCQACHNAAGVGVPGVFPPLVDSDWVTGSTERLAMILLKGLNGPIKVNGTPFNGVMPAWETLSDKDIAQVMSYVRNSWGNNGDLVTEAMVGSAREKYGSKAGAWTEADLLGVGADAMLPGEAVDPDNPETWPQLQK
jgi:mono/diheme cytochrome c family protein